MYMEVQVPWKAGSRERPGAIYYTRARRVTEHSRAMRSPVTSP